MEQNNALARKFNAASLLRFALPNIAMMMLLSMYTIVDGTKTITFDEIAAKDAPEGNGSDLGCFAPPKNLNVCKYAEVFVL